MHSHGKEQLTFLRCLSCILQVTFRPLEPTTEWNKIGGKLILLLSTQLCAVDCLVKYRLTHKNKSLIKALLNSSQREVVYKLSDYCKILLLTMLYISLLQILLKYVDLQYYIGLSCVTQWFDIFIDHTLDKVIIKYWLCSLCCALHHCKIFFITNSLYCFKFFIIAQHITISKVLSNP